MDGPCDTTFTHQRCSSLRAHSAAYLAASTACELKRVAEESEQEQADPRPWARASTAAEHEEDRKELERSGCRASSTISMPPELSASETPSAKGSEGGQLGHGVGADGDSMRSWLLRRWSDEDAQVVSCGLYMLGDVIYAFGAYMRSRRGRERPPQSIWPTAQSTIPHALSFRPLAPCACHVAITSAQLSRAPRLISPLAPPCFPSRDRLHLLLPPRRSIGQDGNHHRGRSDR